MFETTVKHFVYDFCIGLVLDKWNSAFAKKSGEVPKIGDFIGRISHVFADEHYYDCVVKNVITKETKDGQPYLLVYIDYQRSEGDAIDEWEEEINDYISENDIKLEDNEDNDEDYIEDSYEVVHENLDELMNDEEVEFMEYPDMICLNSLYYVFYK